MHFFQKAVSSSSASPSAPSVSSKDSSANACNIVINRGQSSFTQRRLTRQRKLRHVSDRELGFQFIDPLNSPPSSPDSARKQRYLGCSDRWSSAVPQPLPLPEWHLTKRPESLGSIFGQGLSGSPEEGRSSVLRRSGADRVVTKFATCSSNCHQRFSQEANVDGANYNLRLNIAARSAPTSRFSSPMVSPRRSNVEELFTHDVTDPTKYSSKCCKGQPLDLNAESFKHKLSRNASPRSAPTSGFSSPAVSPQRSNTGDFLPSFVASQACHKRTTLEVLDLGRHVAHISQVSPLKSVHGSDHSPFHSPPLQSPRLNPKSHNKFSFTLHNKLLHGNSKEWPETNSYFIAHPLPLPPGAAPPHSSMPSPPAILHQTIEKPNVSSRITQWQKGKLIGRGTYGSVYVGTNRETGALCAMKEVDIIPDDRKSAECIKQLEQEIRLLQHLKHPNIVQYYGSEIVDDHFYIYLEYVYPGSISKYVHEHCGVMTESIVHNFTCHILSGLDYLHSTKTIHRDIKGANLLVDSSGVVKLADFGMAKCLTGLSYEWSLKGSPHWMAPEVINPVMQKDANPDLALAVDIWSLGCTVIEMFTGKPPWGELQGPQAMFKVLNKSPPIPEAMSPEAKDFLDCCFQRNPAERPSASMLLEHPFVLNSSELNALASRQTLSAINLKDKSQSSRDCAAQNIDLMPTSPDTWIMNDKMPSNSENGQQSCVKTFNCAATCYHSPCSPLEVLPCLSTSQLVYDSHNFTSSSNVSSNMPLGAVNYHPLALLRSHGREVPNI